MTNPPINDAERALLGDIGQQVQTLPPFTEAELAVLDSFEYHQPTDEQIQRIAAIRQNYRNLAAFIMRQVRPSADRTAALRQLHESQMTTLKAIVCGERTPVAVGALRGG